MGKALYRKHRSRSLDEVVGQDHITKTLKNAIKNGNVSHAYLFTGPRGVGKTSIARILAHEINGLEYNDESVHLDIIEIDAASNRRIDEIRDLRDKVHIAPTSSKYKVYIIDEVHMLTREAFNALLKTLEEPPEHVIFILATTEAHKIPETITSRTQKFTFKSIDPEDAVKHLREIGENENINVNNEALELIARHGRGSFRDSISILDQLSGLGKDSYDSSDVSLLLGLPDEDVIDKIIQSTLVSDSKQLFESVVILQEKGVDPNQCARSISSKIRELVISGELEMDQTKAITLLNTLLPLTGGPASYTQIELALLGCMDLNLKPSPTPTIQINQKEPISKETSIENIKTSPKTQTQNTPDAKPLDNKVETKSKIAKKDEDTSQKGNDASISSENDITTRNNVATDPSDFNETAWIALLDDLKKKYNTLFGVLRMGEVSSDEQNIIIKFEFGFHKKRVEASKNATILKGYVNEHFPGKGIKCIIEPKSSKAKSTAESKLSSPEVDNSNSVDNVSNIFNGAQLLDS